MKTHITRALLFITLLSQPAIATPLSEEEPGFYADPKVCRGWYCYESFSEPVEPPEERSKEFLVDWNAVWTLEPEKLRELINNAMSHAQVDPSDEERMLTYMKLQGVAMRRAKYFQEAWGEVLLKYPVLDATVSRSPTQAGTTAEVVAEREDRAVAISQLKETMGLVYFYSPSCRYCQQQHGIVDAFAHKWGWKNVTAVNIDQNTAVIDQYGIQSVPDIWVVGQFNGELVQRRLHSGLTEHADIERGILSAFSIWSGEGRYERPEMARQITSFDDLLYPERRKGQ